MKIKFIVLPRFAILLCVLQACIFFVGCSTETSSNDKANSNIYAKPENWAYTETDINGKDADVFFICPTLYYGTADAVNMPLDDEETKKRCMGCINMEKGIYDDNCRFFAPYYSQMGDYAYDNYPYEQCEVYLNIAFEDIKSAFLYYLDNYNNKRPIVIAGFSQGADMSIRLIKECFGDKSLQDRLVACYAIGWRITGSELEECPHLKFACAEDDTGVVISFNSEAEGVESSQMIPSGVKTLAINPLNWKTDSTPAPKELNKGACFTNSEGEIYKEINNLTGAYIDNERGALKITDFTPDSFPQGIRPVKSGVYHGYDFQFFYRNLEENVQKRIKSFLNSQI